jgi:hypothetical protein
MVWKPGRALGVVPTCYKRRIDAYLSVQIHLWTMCWKAPTLLFLFAFAGGHVHGQQFVNVTPASLINVLDSDDHGKGISFHDIDGNGWDDLSLSSGAGNPIFYLNFNGVFQPAPFVIPNAQGARISMILWADFDNDGDADLFITKYGGPVELWRNEGNLQFTNITVQAGLSTVPVLNAGAAFCDYDHDGCLDLYVARFYGMMDDSAPAEFRGVLYRSDCNGGFTVATTTAGVLGPAMPIFQPVFFDYDGDGWEDLFLVVDRTMFPNVLYRNNGDGSFTNVSQASGMNISIDAMSGTIGDPDNDGDLDVFMTNTPETGGHVYMRNDGNGTFSDRTVDMGLSYAYMGWGGQWIDYDNDSWEDLFVSVHTTANSATNQFFVNTGGTGFDEGTDMVGLGASPIETFTCARGDIDNDGYFDMLTNNRGPHNSRLYKNTGGTNHFLSITLQGTLSNRDGIGTWLHCHVGGQKYVRFTLCGSDFMTQNSSKQIFGLGSNTMVDSLVVLWNRGTRDVYYNVGVDQHLHLVEGASIFPGGYTIAMEGGPYLCAGDTIVLDAGEFASYAWNTGHDGRYLLVTTPGTYQVTSVSNLQFVITSEPLTIEAAPPLTIGLDVEPPSCNGMSDGQITATFSNAPLQSIVWSTGDTGITTLDDLAAGGYSFQVVDSYGCSATDGTFLPEPPLLVATVTTTDVPCAGDATGTAMVNAQGGTPPYTMDWGGLDPNALAAGNGTVMLVDANDCPLSVPYSIFQPEELLVFVTTLPDPGDGTGGGAQASITGGVPPYAIQWSSGQSDVTAVEGLEAGPYQVTVTDANDCQILIDLLIGMTSMEDLADDPQVVPYPNPTTGTLWLSHCPQPKIALELLDMSGRRVLHMDAHDCQAPLELARLSPGMYILRMTTGRRVVDAPILFQAF